MNIYSNSHLSRAGAQRGSEGDVNNGDIILFLFNEAIICFGIDHQVSPQPI